MPSKPSSQSSPSPTAKLKEDESPAQLDTFENKPAYAIPRRRPPRPPPHGGKKPATRSHTVDHIPASDKGMKSLIQQLSYCSNKIVSMYICLMQCL